MSRNDLFEVVVFTAAGLAGIGTGLPVRDFADAVLSLLKNARDKSLGSSIENVFNCIPTEQIPEPIIITARAVTLSARISARDAFKIAGTMSKKRQEIHPGELVADLALKRTPDLLVGLSLAETKQTRQLLSSIYEAFLRDPNVVESLRPDALAALLAMQDHLAVVKTHIASALASIKQDLLLHDGRQTRPAKYPAWPMQSVHTVFKLPR